MLWEFFLPMPLKPSVPQFMRWQRTRHDWATEQVYVVTFLCSLVGLIFFGAKGVFGMDVHHLFHQCMLILISLIGNDLVNRICTEFWAGPPLCSAVIFALSGVESTLSLFVRIKTPWSVSKLFFWSLLRVKKNWSTPSEKEDTEFPCPAAVHL